MSRTNICKNIVQSIKDYITDQVKLEPHRVEKHFVRRRKLSLLQVIIYLFFSSKASMFQNLSQIREELGTLSFPDVSKRHDNPEVPERSNHHQGKYCLYESVPLPLKKDQQFEQNFAVYIH